MEKYENNKINWYDSGNVITSLIIGIIAIIIICSQAFVISGDKSLAMFGSVINHNSIYLLVVVYFICLKTHFGKRYFNYLNLFLIIIYLLATATSLLTVVQSFSLNTVLAFIINFVVIIYLFHTMFRDTRIWKEYKLGNSPFNELNNEWLFYTLLVLSLLLLTVNLISTVVISGVIISILDTIYIILFGRYIFLYREYLDHNKKDNNNPGNFSEVGENIKNTVDDVTDKINEFIEDNKIDEKFEKVKENIKNTVDDVTDKVNDFIEDNEIDEKIDKIKDKVTEEVKSLVQDEKKKETNSLKSSSKKVDSKKNSKKTTTSKKKGDNK